MCPGITDNLLEVDDTRKTAIIDRELKRLNIDIAALKETRLSSDGSIREEDYTIFWQGREPQERRQHGVGFAVRNSLLSSIEPPSRGTERILSLRLQTASGPVNILGTDHDSWPKCIGRFGIGKLNENGQRLLERHRMHPLLTMAMKQRLLQRILSFDCKRLRSANILGTDHDSWPKCIGRFGIGKLNENVQRLLEVCTYHDLCITNTFFFTKPCHKVSWRHPRSHHWHQLDLVITQTSSLNSVQVTRSYHSADCGTDHSLIASRVRLQPRRIHRSKQKGRPRINTAKISNPDLHDLFADSIEQALQDCPSTSAEERWNHIRDAIHHSAMEIYGKREKQNPDWFVAGIAELEPVIEAKRAALANYKSDPSVKTLTALRTARRDVQRVARRCANNYWLSLCQSIQLAADNGNTRGMYAGIKKVFGPTIKKTLQLKGSTGEVITDKKLQMGRWIEHYQELYSREIEVNEATIESIESLPVMEDLDSEPSEELKKVVNSLSSGKAPGKDGIPSDIIKVGKDTSLLRHLYELLCQWDRSECNNYRGISLLSTVGKTFVRVILSRLQTLAARVYPESQCGFRAGRSTIDMIFSIRQLQEKSREQRQPLYIAFIDLTKAFDLVSRKILFNLLQKIGCPPTLLRLIVSFHDDMQGTIQYDDSTLAPFPIKNGVKQGCLWRAICPITPKNIVYRR
eukprot:XP_011664237.1 PREDICTED: uncharacterized protein LOC100887870 [Strongylocentrotus purpuratus]